MIPMASMEGMKPSMHDLRPVDEFWMKRALHLASEADVIGEVPVGAVVVLDGKEIGAGFNAPISVDAAGTTLAVDRGGRLFAIDETGVERWRVVIGTHTYQAPVLAADGTLYVVTEQGALHAYR